MTYSLNISLDIYIIYVHYIYTLYIIYEIYIKYLIYETLKCMIYRNICTEIYKAK